MFCFEQSFSPTNPFYLGRCTVSHLCGIYTSCSSKVGLGQTTRVTQLKIRKQIRVTLKGTGTRKLTISSPSINLTKKNARVNKFCFNRKRKASKFIFKEEVLGILSKPCLMTTWQIEWNTIPRDNSHIHVIPLLHVQENYTTKLLYIQEKHTNTFLNE